MTVGMVAIIGAWLFASSCAISRWVGSLGFYLGVIVACGVTVYVLH